MKNVCRGKRRTKIIPSQPGEHRHENDENTVNCLRILLGCAGLATVSWGIPTHAIAASCGRPPYATGLHALAVQAQPNAGIGLSTGETAPTNIDEFHFRSIVGLFHVVYTSGGMTVQESFDSWYGDGNEFEAADFFGVVCQGTWVSTDPGKVRLFHTAWNFDPTGTLLGYFTEIQVDTLSSNGMSYDGTFALQNFDMSGNHIVGQDLSGNRPCDTIDRAVSGRTASDY